MRYSFFFFYEDVISVYYNTQEIPHNLIIDSQFLMYDVLKITVCQFSSVGTRAWTLPSGHRSKQPHTYLLVCFKWTK